MSVPKKIVLSIDDSKAVHAFLDRCLNEGDSEFEFLHALGVGEGLKILTSTPTQVSAILLDWEMPEINGFEGLPMILEKAPQTPVIILTSKNEPSDISMMLERGATEYMMKPFTPDILFEKLKSVVGE